MTANRDNVKIRIASVDDAEAILKIYAYYVEKTAIAFECDVPTVDEFKARIANTLKKYPYFVAVRNDKIIGYTYAGAFVGRAAYNWSAEMTIYLAADEKRQGLGRLLYETLENALVKMGITNLYACIGYPETEDEYLTANSAQFHEHMGYVKCGEFRRCGYKFGRWYHMIWMEKIIGKYEKKQPPVRCFSDINKFERVMEVLNG